MRKERSVFSIRALVLALALAALSISACATRMTDEEVQVLVETSVAQTVEAQNSMATSVAQTMTSLAPAASATPLPTLAPASLPTLTPIVPTVTPFVMSSGGGGGGSKPAVEYACAFTEVKPPYNVFKPGDYIDFVWIITNTGTKTWPSALDLDFVSGTHFSPYVGEELPQLKSGERVTVSFEGNAPDEPGFYNMSFKVQGGLCFPFTDIEVIKPPGEGG